ncbi:MAG: peptide-methionine (S)-S-oxide reductase MsrA [Gloeobacteraceae cyanobacterium ES-bin-144]|nr:peptide-methionine (S)-S-oxide reductase MsrA [Verrucomicrobiales bacterium]
MKFSHAIVAAAILFTGMLRAGESKQATFAAGCFWCMEAIFERVPGVTKVVSGYAGGKEKDPTYEQVGSGRTGHCEAIEITYDPEKTSYSKLLDVFWRSHDSTDARGVAPDFGKQYRSALFYRTPEEKLTIEQSKAVLEKRLGKSVATQISPFEKFYPAEAYHQDYVKLHPNASYVRNVSIPRLIEAGFKE